MKPEPLPQRPFVCALPPNPNQTPHPASVPDDTRHACDWSSPWPTGHPLPPEDPAKLQGPEVDEFVLYRRRPDAEPQVVRVIERSYVWSPGECRSKGGYRHYDWKVIEFGPGKYRSVVVDDHQLSPLPSPARARTISTYGLTYSTTD